MSDLSPAPFTPEERNPARREVDLLLTNISWLVTCDERMQCFRAGAIAVDGTDLLAVGQTGHVQQQFRARSEMDLSGFLVLPGLINTHTHAAMTCFRGLADDLPLLRWLHEVIFPAEAAAVNPEMVYRGTLLAGIEMLKNGITTFCDGYFFEEAAARAALDCGMRAILGQGVLDFPTPDQPDPSRSRDRVETFFDAFPEHTDRLRPSIFCHTPYTCRPETLQWAKRLSKEHGILFQIHLSETAAEVEDMVQRYGERPVFHLDRLGVLDDRSLCAHAVWLDPGEIELLAARQVRISHNVESNMKLASGVAPVPRMLAAGITIGLGTDGCASNNNLDLFSEMDKVAKLHKVIHRDPVVCPAPRVLAMATRDGAVAIGWEDAIGSLEVGKKADLIAIDCNQPHLTPLYDPASHLVYAVKGSDVRHVWVNGDMVVRDGQVLKVNEIEAIAAVNRLAGRIRLDPR
jgi:5-methylthioadenosine/S-adenosylhomocysteine deaminase